MGQKPPPLSSILAALVFALSCFAFTLFAWISFGGPVPFDAKGYRFHAVFGSEAAQLSTNAEARIAGVPIGKVVAVSRRGTRIDATIELERDYAPLPADARAIMRTKTLLGENFIEITPGSKNGAKLPEGGVLPADQVAPVEGLDEVLSAFDRRTRNDLKKLLRGFTEAFEGRGDDLNAALGNAGPGTEQFAQLMKILDAQKDDVQTLVRDAGVALRAIARREDDVTSLVTAGEQVFSTTADRNRELTDTVRALPPFLRDLRGTLAKAEGTLDAAAPTLKTLRPVAPLVRPALEETSKIAPELRATFRGLDKVITSSRSGLPALTRTVDALRPLLGQLHPVTRDLVPVVEYLDAYKREGLMTAANVSASTQATAVGADGKRRHYLRSLIPIWNELSASATERLPTNRWNPYPEPGELDQMLQGGLRSWSCEQTTNRPTIPPLLGEAPPCRQAPPWTFRGTTSYFPHLERDRP